MIDLKIREPNQKHREKRSKKVSRPLLFALLLIACIGVGFYFYSPNKNTPSTQVTIPLPIQLNQTDSFDLKQIYINDPFDDLQASIHLYFHPHSLSKADAEWEEITVKAGDNLSTVFGRMALTKQDMAEVLSASPEAEQLGRLHPGNKILFTLNEDGKLQKLHYIRNPLESILLTRYEKGFKVTTILREPEIRTTFANATIKDSLFLSVQRAGYSSTLAMNLANIFGWDVDFALDIRDGDSFNVVFEEHYLDGRKIRDGDILSAQFTNRGKTFTAIRYTNEKGEADYYNPEGYGMRKQFLRTPVDFARISSTFTLRRYHPVLHKFRAHKGVDYAASSGTPIKAAGNGKIEFVGKKNGYGNTIVIDHGNQYSTLYAHMKGFASGIHNGKRVKQGQVIGYVGSTGLATGPHLHYEFRINGVHKNPLTVKLAYTQPINPDELPRFKLHVKEALAQLDAFKLANKIASAAPSSKLAHG